MASAVTAPFKWLGGKSKLARKLVPLLPPHRVYVEAFGGAAALLLAKPPSPVEVFNDIDSGVVNFFRVLRDPEKFARFLRMAYLTPYSREEWRACRGSWRRVEGDEERAWAWFVVARMSFGGIFGKSWGFSVKPARGVAEPVSQWLGAVEALPEVAERFRRVIVENRDFRELIPLYDGPDVLWYMDPPYVPEARRAGSYAHEMSLEDHRDLVRLLLGLEGMAILSGYRHPVYAPLEEAGWARLDFPAACHAAGRTRASGLRGEGACLGRQRRVESVWLSPRARAAAGRGRQLDLRDLEAACEAAETMIL